MPKDCSSARHGLPAPPKSAPSTASRPSDAEVRFWAAAKQSAACQRYLAVRC
jgi:hypothetical protein